MGNLCSEAAGFAIYESILQKVKNRVLSKLGLSDAGITWKVFLEEPCVRSGIFPLCIVPQNGYRYGWCDVDKRIIGISTAAIMRAPAYDLLTMVPIDFFPRKDNFLVNVILDELAHITTGKDHGNGKYDRTLLYYYIRYYLGNA